MLAVVALACTSEPPPSPTVSPAPTAAATSTLSASPSPRGPPEPTPPPKVVGSLELEACDPAGELPCEPQSVFLSRAIVGTGVALSFSTEWAPGRLDRPEWDAATLGLGGWSLNVLERYDPANGVLLSGDGTWRIVEAFDLGGGEQAVPSLDGLRVFIFDSAWRHLRTIDDITGATLVTFSYDSDGRLAGAEGSMDSDPIHLSITRAREGRSIELVGIAGAETLAFVNERGDLTSLSTTTGDLSIIPGSWGLIDAWESAAGNRTTYTYDQAGRLATSTDPDGVARRFERVDVAGGFEVHVTSALERVTTTRHETFSGAAVRSVTPPSGLTTRLEIAPDGARTLAFPDGTVVSVGNQPHPRWGIRAGIPTPYVERRPDGSQHRQEIAAIVNTGPGEEPYGRPWQIDVLVDGQRWVRSYDPATRTLTWTDPTGRVTSDTFDEAGRVIARERPSASSESYAYDTDGRLQSITRGTTETAAVTSFAHDPQTGEVRVTRPDGLVETWLYDGMGRIARTDSPDGSAVTYRYDADGRLIQVRYGDHPSTTLGYTGAGRASAYLPPVAVDDASYELRTYDEEGNVAAIVGPGDRSVAFAYDDAGRAASLRFDSGELTIEYDPETGQVAGLVAPGGVETRFRYAGRLPVGIAWTGRVVGDVSLSLDAGSRLSGETVNGEDPIAYARDDAGYLVGVDDLSFSVGAEGLPTRSTMGIVDTAWSYDADRRLTEAVMSVDGKAVQTLRYERDALGRISAIERTGPGRKTSRVEYSYDEADRLLAVSLDGVDVETYAYDAAGNRISVARPSGTVTGSYDDRDRLLSWGTATYEYAGDGTLAARRDAGGSTLYDYDDFGKLRSATLADGHRVEYVVDGGGRRLGRIVDGELVAGYLYRPDGPLVAQTDGDGAVVARFAYDDGDRLVSMRRDGRTYRIVTDHLGSPILVVDAETGQVAQEIEYDPWGVVLVDSNPGFTPFGFAGGLQDPDTGLVRFGARDYDPATGRWTGPDPIRFEGGDPNLYRYVGADPVNSVDPTGLRQRAEYVFKPLPPPPPPPVEYVWPPVEVWNLPPPPPPPLDLNFNGVPDRDEREPTPAPPTPPAPPAQPPGGVAGSGTSQGLCSFGDPHLRTGDGSAVDFQSAGEFTVSRSPDGMTIVQTRQVPPSGTTTVTLTSAVAMLVAGDRVGIYADKERQLIINGEVQTRIDLAVRLPGGGVVERHGSEVAVDWPDGSRLIVDIYGYFLNYDFAPAAALAPTLVGVLGSRDGVDANDLTTSAGAVLDPDEPAFFDRLHREFADSWRITQEESLFDYLPGETTDTFTLREIPTARATIAGIDDASRQAAQKLCRAVGVTSEPILSECILDVGLTGDPSFAGSAASIAAATTGSATGPVVDAVEIEIGSPTSGEFQDAEEVDRYRFSATAGQVVYLDAQGDCVDDLWWRLLRPDGTLFAFERTCQDIGREVLPEVGDWIIEVYSDTKALGAYSFTILSVPPAMESAITVGSELSGDVAEIGAWHRYRFSATAGQVVYLDAQGDCVDDLWWRLLRPDGTLFDFQPSCQDIGREVLPEAGDWIIEVYSDTKALGAYSFTLGPED